MENMLYPFRVNQIRTSGVQQSPETQTERMDRDMNSIRSRRLPPALDLIDCVTDRNSKDEWIPCCSFQNKTPGRGSGVFGAICVLSGYK